MMFSNQFAISGLLETWIVEMEPLYVFFGGLFNYILKQVCSFFRCSGECCYCFAVKLETCLMDYETSTDFPSAWG